MAIPQHISIIMDGNGRWARQQGKIRLFGHKAGKETVRQVTTECAKIGVRYLSLFAFSEENWNRPADEVKGLMELMLKSMIGERETLMKNNIRFRVIGNYAHLSETLLEAIRQLEADTAGNTRMTLILMLSYSGKWDLLQAARRFAADTLAAGRELPLDENTFASYLATAGIPDPDLLIRTSGEQRLSNFLPWQTTYAEFIFDPINWPEFNRARYLKCLQQYADRDRRFGGVKTDANGEVKP